MRIGLKRNDGRKPLAGPVLALVLLVVAVTGSARAQEVERIAAVVNDEIVSIYDLVQRIKFVMFASGLQPSAELRRRLAPQALRALINERLRLQEAARNNVTVSAAEVGEAVAQIESRNRIPHGDFKKYLRARGLDPDTVLQQFKAQIAWTKLIRRRMGTQLRVGDDEVDAEMARIQASAGKTEYLVSEIFLVADDPNADEQVRRNAAQLVAQIRGGADFAALAREFSASTTATSGGNLGWVLADEVGEEIAPVIQRLAPGAVSDPIRVNGGYLVVRVNDRRRRLAANPDQTRVGLKQVFLPLAAGASAEARAGARKRMGAVAAAITGCDTVAAAAARIDAATAGDLGTVRLGDLPNAIKRVVAPLPVGRVSAPIETADGIRLLVVCKRDEAKAPLPSRDDVTKMLMARRFERASRQYLRDLRREAFVDVRI